MASNIRVEVAEESRIEEVLPHFRTYQKCYSEFAGATEGQTRDFLTELTRDSRSGVVLIASEGARIVGFATAFVTVSGVLASRILHLGDLYVVPEYRGQKIGERLVEAVRIEASKRSIPLVRWLSVASNERLNAWYDSLGAKSYDFKLFIVDAREGQPKT
jgi:GNAT superfamily N-acetyltransferase